MKINKPSIYQKRLDLILEQYRDKEPRPAAELAHWKRLWKEYVAPLRWRLLAAGILSMIINLQPFIWTTIMAWVVDTVLMVGKTIPAAEMGKHFTWVIYLFFINCSIHLSTSLFSWQASYQMTIIGQRVVFELRKALHVKLNNLPLTFFDRTQTGRLLSIVLDDVSTIQSSIGGVILNFANNFALLSVGLTTIFMLNWRLSLLVLIAMPVYVINFRHFRPRIREGNITARRANTAIYNKMEERVSAIKTIKVFGRERSEVHSFAEATNNLARLTMHTARLGAWQSIIANTISPLVTGIILYIGLNDYRHGMMSLGQVLRLFTNIAFLFPPAVAVNDLIGMELPRVNVVLRRVFDLMDSPPEPEDCADAVSLPDAKGDIQFDHVTFTYPGDEQASLTDVSFTIPAGKQVAIIGPSGAGKSSLLYLLMRFYDPSSGSISLDGYDLCALTLRTVRERITLVMQEPVIFSGSVAENIRYGRLDASDEEVKRAARDADLHQFIMSLPDGYETVVGERGMSLSGGQRQRLALAASLLSRPSVLLLDDTTSALDPGTEARVRETLHRLMKGRTCFVVTHRISTAMASDLVLVLEDGHVTQFGEPTVLLGQEGLMRRVYEQQIRESADLVGEIK